MDLMWKKIYKKCFGYKLRCVNGAISSRKCSILVPLRNLLNEETLFIILTETCHQRSNWLGWMNEFWYYNKYIYLAKFFMFEPLLKGQNFHKQYSIGSTNSSGIRFRQIHSGQRFGAKKRWQFEHPLNPKYVHPLWITYPVCIYC